MIERGYSAAGRMNLMDVVREIQARAGSDRKAAAMVGVHHRTWQRWRRGEAQPNILHLLAVGSAVRQIRAETRPFRADTLTIKTEGKDGRRRTIRGSQLGFGLEHEARIERAFIAEGGDAAARAFIGALGDTPAGRDWYQEYFTGLAREDETDDLFEDLQYEGSDSDMDAYSAGSAGASW